MLAEAETAPRGDPHTGSPRAVRMVRLSVDSVGDRSRQLTLQLQDRGGRLAEIGHTGSALNDVAVVRVQWRDVDHCVRISIGGARAFFEEL